LSTMTARAARAATRGRARWPIFIGIAVAVFVLDQLAKAWLVSTLSPGERIQVVGDYVRLIHSQNTGALFGLFRDQALFFAIVSVGVVGAIVWFYHSSGRNTLLSVALGLLLGGRRVGSIDVGKRGVDVGRHVDDVSGEVGEGGHGSVLDGHADCRRAKKVVTSRAAMLVANTIAISVSAAPQARSWAGVNGEMALLKICTDSAVFWPLNRLVLVSVTVPMVKSRGAVSPAARATASRAPLTMPAAAFGSTTVRMVRALRLPSA